MSLLLPLGVRHKQNELTIDHLLPCASPSARRAHTTAQIDRHRTRLTVAGQERHLPHEEELSRLTPHRGEATLADPLVEELPAEVEGTGVQVRTATEVEGEPSQDGGDEETTATILTAVRTTTSTQSQTLPNATPPAPLLQRLPYRQPRPLWSSRQTWRSSRRSQTRRSSTLRRPSPQGGARGRRFSRSSSARTSRPPPARQVHPARAWPRQSQAD